MRRTDLVASILGNSRKNHSFWPCASLACLWNLVVENILMLQSSWGPLPNSCSHGRIFKIRQRQLLTVRILRPRDILTTRSLPLPSSPILEKCKPTNGQNIVYKTGHAPYRTTEFTASANDIESHLLASRVFVIPNWAENRRSNLRTWEPKFHFKDQCKTFMMEFEMWLPEVG